MCATPYKSHGFSILSLLYIYFEKLSRYEFYKTNQTKSQASVFASLGDDQIILYLFLLE